MSSKLDIWTVVGLIMVIALAIYQIVDYVGFRTAGNRFTAADGQTLCLRIQRLDGFPCGYGGE